MKNMKNIHLHGKLNSYARLLEQECTTMHTTLYNCCITHYYQYTASKANTNSNVTDSAVVHVKYNQSINQ